MKSGNFIVKILISTLAVIGAAYVLPGVHLDDLLTAIMVAITIAVLNHIAKPVFIVLTIPLTILSFGLFLLVINAIIIELADWIVDGFKVDSFWWALLFSLVLSLLNSVFEQMATDKNKRRK